MSDLETRRIQIAIEETLAGAALPIREFLNQWQAHRRDINDLISARKLRVWITEPPKSKCTPECARKKLAEAGHRLEIEATT